jgi:methylthioribose-1-phosphate isomerase
MEGARLASWELRQLDVDHHVIADSAVAWLFARETVDAVLIAPEWIAADGATAGVIGSRAIALQAGATAPGPDGERPRIYVCGSSANVDPNVADGESIPLEMRPARELTTYLSGVAVRASDAKVPATDVMPPGTIHALVTEQGVASPVTRDTIAALLHGAASEAA